MRRQRIDLSVGQMLAAGFTAVALLLAALLVFTFTSLQRIRELRRDEVEAIAPKAQIAARLEAAVLYRAVELRNFALGESPEALSEYEEATRVVSEHLTSLRAYSADPKAREQFARIEELSGRHDAASQSLVALVTNGAAPAQIRQAEARVASSREALLGQVRQYSSAIEAQLSDARQDRQRLERDIGYALAGLAVVLLGLLSATSLVTVRSVRGPVLELLASARRLATGDYEPAVALAQKGPERGPAHNELTELARSFGAMALALRVRERRLNAGARFAAQMASSLQFPTLCQEGLREVLLYLGEQRGAVYLLTKGRLNAEVCQGLALDPESAGQVVQTRRPLVRDSREQGGQITSVPLLFQDEVLGVLQVQTAHPLSPDEMNFLEQSARQLALSLRNAQTHEALHSRAEQMRLQGEQLERQSARLQQALSSLAERETQYRQLFTHLSEGLALHEIILDEQGHPVDYRFLEVNPAFERLTGLSAESIVGRTVLEVLPHTEPHWIETYGKVAATGEPLRFDSYSREIGKHLEVIAFRPRPGHFATLFFDITQRKKAEAALQDADRRKNDFLGVLSHELRNPLAPVRNSLSILERAEPGSEAARRAQTVIKRQVGQLTRLIDDLLDITRITRGKVRLQRATVDLVGLARQCADDYRPSFSERGIDFRVSAPEEEIMVEADAARLSQVIGNLLQNAAKFTPKDGLVVLTVQQADGQVRIGVRDTGVGIKPEVLKRLFEPFMQADETLARTGGGLGMGLALVKGLVELHGGKVRAMSRGLDQGAEFIVELPQVDSEPRAAPRAVPEAASPQARRVLVIEDNLDAAESLRDALALSGHQVELAFDGPEGLRKVKALRPEIVLCDLGLPGMDGYEVARAIRADKTLAGIYLVALSGYALPEDVKRATEAGFGRHLAKPASLEALEQVIAEQRFQPGPLMGTLGETRRSPMARKVSDCRDTPNLVGCTLTISGEEEEVVRAAAEHSVSVHGEKDSAELRRQIRSRLKDEGQPGLQQPSYGEPAPPPTH